MIKTVKCTSGYASELPNLKDRTFEFKKGLNVLFGPNGCGKSTLLKIASAYCGIETKYGGWTRGVHKSCNGGAKQKEFPEAFVHFSPKECKAEVSWDGTSSFLFDTSKMTTETPTFFVEGELDSFDGMTGGMSEQLQVMFGHQSQGEFILYKLMKLKEMLSTPFDVFKEYEKENIDRNKVALKKQCDYTTHCAEKYIRSLVSNGIKENEIIDYFGYITVFMDEPDRNLSVENQIKFWKNFLPNMSDCHQVVIATHSTVALALLKDSQIKMNFIDLQQGYAEENGKLFSELFKKW